MIKYPISLFGLPWNQEQKSASLYGFFFTVADDNIVNIPKQT